jgi:hypothetical protein
VLQKEQVGEPGNVVFGHSETGTARDHEVDLVRACDRSHHDIPGPMVQDPHEHIPLFLIKVNHARSRSAVAVAYPSRGPRRRGGQDTLVASSVRAPRVTTCRPPSCRLTSPLGGARATRSRVGVGRYEFRVRRRNRAVSPDYAISRARETAFADGVRGAGDPTVQTKRVPLPLIGPRTEFIVGFPRATRAN